MLQEEKSQIIVDKEGGLRRLGGDQEIYNELMELFIDQTTEQVEQLKEAVKNRTAESVQKIAHSIKGAAANLGVMVVQKTAFELEQIGSNNELDDAEKLLSKLIFEFERAKQYWEN